MRRSMRGVGVLLAAVISLAAALPAVPAAAAGTSTVVFGAASEVDAGGGSTLYGMVVDASGQPVSDATVQVSAQAGTVDGAAYATVQTDSLGDFTATYQAPASAGTDTITASIPGDTGTAQVAVEPVGTVVGMPSMSSDVTVADPTASASTIDGGETVTLTSSVTQDGVPVVVPVTIWSSPPGTGGTAVADGGTTDSTNYALLASGSWTFGAQVMDGNMDILASSLGGPNVTVTSDATETVTVAAPTTVASGGTITASGTVTATSTATGQTYPIPGALIQLSASGMTLASPYVITDANGAFAATATLPGATGPATITATEPQGGGTATATVTVTAPPLAVATTTLPSGTVGQAYTATLQAFGGTAPYTWSVSSGTLPAGLALSGATISGTPTAAGTSSITVQAVDSTGATASQGLTIDVSAAPAPPAPPTPPAPPAPTCISSADLPADYSLAGCVATLSAPGPATLTIPAQPAQGTLIVYELTSTHGVLHYLPTSIAPTAAAIAAASPGEYAVLDSTRTYPDLTSMTPPTTARAVALLTAAGATVGYQSGDWHPDAPATLGQVSQMASVVLGLSAPVPVAADPPGNWARPYMVALAQALGSTPPMALAPGEAGQALTQAQFADLWAAVAHVTAPTMPDPAAPVTRAQVAQILAAWIQAQAPAQ